jgi:hypothetical protein
MIVEITHWFGTRYPPRQEVEEKSRRSRRGARAPNDRSLGGAKVSVAKVCIRPSIDGENLPSPTASLIGFISMRLGESRISLARLDGVGLRP